MATDADALNAQVDLVRVVGHLAGPIERKGNEYVGRCVNHAPDEHPSMWVRPRKGIVSCKSCGFEADAIHFVMHVMRIDEPAAAAWLKSPPELTPALTAPKRIPPPERVTSKPPADAGSPNMALRSGPPSIVWPYLDTDGSVLGYMARYPGDDGEDTFRTWTWGSVGGAPPTWAIGNWTPLRPLYGLDRLAKRPDDPVAVGWTERAADAIARLLPGYVCVTWPGNRQAIHKADWLPLKGRRVTLFPATGGLEWRAQEGLANLLASPYLHCQVDRIDPNQMPPGWDLSVAVAEGWTTDQTIAWGRPRKTAYVYGKPEAAPEAPEAAQDSLPPDPPPEPAPKRSRRPVLATVGGKVVAEVADDMEGEDALPLALSETGVAMDFVATQCIDLRYCHAMHAWFRWTGSRWARDEGRVVPFQRATDFCKGLKYRPEAQALSPASRSKMESAKFIAAVLGLAEYDRRVVITPDQFDTDHYLLGTPAGTVELREGKLIEADPEDYITRNTTVAPAEGHHPLFDQVIECASGGQPELRKFLWRWLGYVLTGSVQEESFLFLFGPAGCGKTTLITAIEEILGNTDDGGYSSVMDMDVLCETKNDRGTDKLAEMCGARFIYSSETEEGRHWKPALLKWITGGDRLRGRRLYENRITWRPTHKLAVFGNFRPHLRAADDGVKRRIHLLEYKAAIAEDQRDLTFKERLRAEYPHILHSMVKGCLAWQLAGGLHKPDEITAAVDEYMESEDSLASWLADCTRADSSARAQAADVYRSYSTYIEARGERPPSSKRLGMMLRQKGFGTVKSGATYYTGLALLDKPGDTWTPDPSW